MKPINLNKSSLLRNGLALAVLLGGTTIFSMQARTQNTSPYPQQKQYYPDSYYGEYYEAKNYNYCYKQGFNDPYANTYYICYGDRPYQGTPIPSNPSIYNPSTPK